MISFNSRRLNPIRMLITASYITRLTTSSPPLDIAVIVPYRNDVFGVMYDIRFFIERYITPNHYNNRVYSQTSKSKMSYNGSRIVIMTINNMGEKLRGTTYDKIIFFEYTRFSLSEAAPHIRACTRADIIHI